MAKSKRLIAALLFISFVIGSHLLISYAQKAEPMGDRAEWLSL